MRAIARLRRSLYSRLNSWSASFSSASFSSLTSAAAALSALGATAAAGFDVPKRDLVDASRTTGAGAGLGVDVERRGGMAQWKRAEAGGKLNDYAPPMSLFVCRCVRERGRNKINANEPQSYNNTLAH